MSLRVICIGLFPALIALSAAPVCAQTGTLSGIVTDVVTERPLPGANVRLEGAAHGMVTDTSGAFRFEGLDAGLYMVVVSYVGYETERQEVRLSGESRRMNIALVPTEVALHEITVSGQGGAFDAAEKLSVVQLSARDLRSIPAVLEPDIFRALQLLPGVKAASDYSSGLYIRGGGPGQTLVLLDRAPVYSPSHFFGFFSTFNPAAIGQVTLYKGGYPAKYGGRLGAVVALTNRNGGSSTSGMASVGLLASRAAISGPFSAGSFMLAGRRSTLEPLLAVLNKLDVDGIPNSFYFYDLNGRLDIDLGASNRLATSFYLGSDAIVLNLFDGDADITLTYGNRVGRATWTHLFSPGLFSRLTVAGSHYESNPAFIVAQTSFEQRLRLNDFSLKGQMVWTPNDRHVIDAGFGSGHFSFGYRQWFNDRETFSPVVKSFLTHVYAQDTFRPSARWEITGGLRANYFAAGGHIRLGPRLSVAYNPLASLRVQAGYGRYNQFLSLNTFGSFSGFDIWLTTGQGVPPAWGDQFVAGLNWRVSEAFNLDVEAYYRTMRDLFKQDPFLADPAGLPYVDIFHFGKGKAYGLELMLRKAGGPFSGFAAYTLSRTLRQFDQLNDERYYSPKYDRTHDLNVVLNYDLTESWGLTSVFTYATGQAYTRPVAQYRLVDPPFQSTPYHALEAPFNNRRLPPYHRLDLGVTKRGRFFGFADYELQLQMINAYGRRNVWFYNYSFTEESTIERDVVPQIPVPLPNVAFTLRF